MSNSNKRIQNTIHGLFEAQVEKTPNNIAVVFNDKTLSYLELNNQSNRLAEQLVYLGAGPDKLVAICLERSIEMLIALIATLKIGAGYIPLDPTMPKDRIQFMVDDSRPCLILTESHLKSIFCIRNSSPILFDIDSDLNNTTTEISILNISRKVNQNSLAYLIYTSGSTGKPKGVLVTHESVVNVFASMKRKLNISASDRFIACTTISFDVAAVECFLPLAVGAQITIASRTTTMNGFKLANLIENSNATMLQGTPATWHMLIEAGWKGKKNLKILCVGEGVSRRLASQLMNLGESVWNLYGPTETTIYSAIAKIDNRTGPVMIGKPILNTEIYILNDALTPQPLGEVGEIYIAGIGLSKGYLNDEMLTKDKFIPNKLMSTPGALIYKTGDRGRMALDGQIEFLGRVDNQVKIRGYRIELSEIESLLKELSFVKEAVAVVSEDTFDNLIILAYVCLHKSHDTNVEDARLHLSKNLPHYMLPREIIIIDSVPITVSGKIDRQRLASAKPFKFSTITACQPNEHTLKKIWMDVLKIEEFGPDDDFFDLGGTSLLAVILVKQINEKLQVKLSLRNFLKNPTISALTKAIQSGISFTSDRNENTINLAKEASLDAGIQLDYSYLNKDTQEVSRSILVTGATGFLGAFLLAELCRQTSAGIYCLVRSDHCQTIADAKARIRTNMHKYALWNDAYDHRILPVFGDLTLSGFGLSEMEYKKLSVEVNSIYHNGAWVNFLLPYEKLKNVNMKGTEEIIRFAAVNRIKTLHYISTVSVFDSFKYVENQDGKIVVRESDDPTVNEDFFNGYAASKWVAERLVTMAKSRGFPVVIYRPGMIAGSSVNGSSNLSDAFDLFIKGCIQLGSAPDLNIDLDIVPVDFVGKAIIALSLQPGNIGGTFHLINPKSISLATFFAIVSSLGYPIKIKKYWDWTEALIKQVRQGKNALAGLLPVFTEKYGKASLTIPQYYSKPHRLKIDGSFTQACLKQNGIICPLPNKKLLESYLNYFVNHGFLS